MKTLRETEIVAAVAAPAELGAASSSGSRIVSGARSTRSMRDRAAAPGERLARRPPCGSARELGEGGLGHRGQASTGLYEPHKLT